MTKQNPTLRTPRKLVELNDLGRYSINYPPYSLVAPLFGAEFLRITLKGMLLRDFQCSSSKDLIVTHHIQEWWCEPAEHLTVTP